MDIIRIIVLPTFKGWQYCLNKLFPFAFSEKTFLPTLAGDYLFLNFA